MAKRTEAASRVLGSGSATSKRVLLLEDAPHVGGAIKALLEDMGMTVVGPATSVREGELLLSKEAPDVAIVDVHLRGEHSFGFIEMLEREGVPVLVITGCEEPATAGYPVLVKPFSGAALMEMVDRLLASP